MELLKRLFGSDAKVKLMKLFVFNEDGVFHLAHIVKKLKISLKEVKREIQNLEKMKLIKSREIKNEQGRKVRGFGLRSEFVHLVALRDFFMNISPLSDEEITERFAKALRVKLIVVSGVFINEPESRTDIVVVGDRIKKQEFAKSLARIEGEFGRELRYALFDMDDFAYRMNVGDKLVRDIFEYPHRIVYNKTGLVG